MLSGHFVSSGMHKLFVSQFGDSQSSKVLLCLPPLFEELNLSRAIVAKQAHFFAEQGLPCFIMDYAGTGDSEGEINQVNVGTWLNNVLDVGEWLKARGCTEIYLWGVRFGGLLALAYQRQIHQSLPVSKQLFWKPVLKGKVMMSQFIRLKQANSMMLSAQEKVNWRQKILAGEEIEIAGYPINAELLSSLEALTSETLLQPSSPVVWMELAASKVTPAIANFIANWPKKSVMIDCFECSAFWQIPEIFELSQLHQHSLKALVGK